VKMQTLGVPLEALWERWGVSPQTRERWKTLKNLPKRDETPPPPARATARLVERRCCTPTQNGVRRDA
jgi:hypothetical protein